MTQTPLVLLLTNQVAANFTSNCLLAVGARPAMVEEPCEAEELAAAADALLVNLGTVTTHQTEAMRLAAKTSSAHQVPWVLDPVGIPFLSFRRQLATDLLQFNPSVIRGNRREIEEIRESAAPGCVLLATGETDQISTAGETLEITGGTPLLQSVTATGCAQGAICAAFLGKGETPWEACTHASRLMKRAGERAAAKAKAIGTFQIALLDALWELSHD